MFLKKLYKSVDNAMKRQLREGLPFVSFRFGRIAAFTRGGVHIRIKAV